MMRPPVVREPVTPLPREERRERMREVQPPAPVPVTPTTREAARERATPAPVATERLVPQSQAPAAVREPRPPAAESRERAAPPADGPKPKKDGPGEARP